MKKKMDVYLNLLIIILEIIGFVISVKALGKDVFLYYTQDSNLFLMLTSIFYLATYNKKDRKLVGVLKFGATLSVLVTFLVVITILSPTMHLSYHWLLFEDANLFYHTLCPILAVVTFLFFDKIEVKGTKDILGAMVFTLIYTVVFLILNLTKVVEGPYPFLKVYENSVLVTIIWFIVIEGGAVLLAKLLEIGKQKQTS